MCGSPRLQPRLWLGQCPGIMPCSFSCLSFVPNLRSSLVSDRQAPELQRRCGWGNASGTSHSIDPQLGRSMRRTPAESMRRTRVQAKVLLFWGWLMVQLAAIL